MSSDSATFLEFLKLSPMGRELFAQAQESAQAETLAHRRDLAQELAKVNAEDEVDAPKRSAALAKARANLEAARQKYQAVADALQAEQARVSSASRTFERRRALLERELRETAPPAITAFLRDLEALAESIRKKGVSYFERRTLSGMVTTASNRESVHGALEDIREARAAVQDLMLEPLTDAELIERLGQIRDGIRAVETVMAPTEAEAR